MITQSLAPPPPAPAPMLSAPAASRAPASQRPGNLKKSLENEALLKKLIQFRDQIPLSKRIIRASSHDLG